MAIEKRDLNGKPADYDTELKAFVGAVPKQPVPPKADDETPETPSGTKKKS